MSLNNGRKLRIWSMNNTSGWYTKMLDKKSQKMKDTWYILEDLNAYFTYFLLLVPRSLGLFMGYTNFTLIQDHQDVLNYFWMFVNLMKDFSVIKWPKESNQTKVPFIYYISTCISQNLICLPKFSQKMDFFVNTKKVFFNVTFWRNFHTVVWNF